VNWKGPHLNASMPKNKAQRESDRNGGLGSVTPLEVRFAQTQSSLNPRRQRLIRSMLDNPEETYFLSSRELARRYNVDAATIVRTIQALGYDRFAAFASDLRRHFVTRITPYTVMKAAAREKRSIADHIRHSIERDAENLNVLRSSLDPDRVVGLAKSIHRARRIVVVGVDLAASLASLLAYGLQPLGFDAEVPIGSAGHLQHKIRLLGEKDLLIAISFGRCLRQTVESVLMARGRGVPTFGITDSDTTAIALNCDAYLIASIASPSITGSYVAPLALINAVFMACAHIRPARSLALLRQTEEEYTSGDRWYSQPARRAKEQSNGTEPALRRTRRQPAKRQVKPRP
jgi:DNA-binding MurR/RpiR family transcriptional regulator